MQFDHSAAAAYSRIVASQAIRDEVLNASVLHAVGNYHDFRLLDLGSGDGQMTRRLLSHGASSVVGMSSIDLYMYAFVHCQ